MADIDLNRAISAAITAGVTAVAADPSTPLHQQQVPQVVDAANQVVQNLPSVKAAQATFDYATSNESPFASWGVYGAISSGFSGGYTILEALWDGFDPTNDKSSILTGGMALLACGLFLLGRYRGKPIGQ